MSQRVGSQSLALVCPLPKQEWLEFLEKSKELIASNHLSKKEFLENMATLIKGVFPQFDDLEPLNGRTAVPVLPTA